MNTPATLSETCARVGSSAPLASVVISTYNRSALLVDTIEMIVANEYPHIELVVVDQTPHHPEEVRLRLEESWHKYRYRYLRLPFPNLPVARNVGIRRSNGQILIFCDDDVVVAPDYVASHVRCYGDPNIGAVAGRVVSAMDGALSHPSGLIGRLNRDGTFIANFHRSDRTDVDFGMGCNMSFRRSALTRAGGFDERYTGGFYREEGDAFARVKQLGYRVVFEPGAALEHLATAEGGCRKDRYVPRMYSVFRNETLFFLNCLDRRHLPQFVHRLLRWMYATVRSNGYSASEFFYFLGAFFGGAKTYYCERADRISASLPV
jgi:GT2 family glycosyltransferase